jgi:hypothetical protein
MGQQYTGGPKSSSILKSEDTSQTVSQHHSIQQVNLLRCVGTNTAGLHVSTGGTTGNVSGSGLTTTLPAPRDTLKPTPTAPALTSNLRRRPWQQPSVTAPAPQHSPTTTAHAKHPQPSPIDRTNLLSTRLDPRAREQILFLIQHPQARPQDGQQQRRQQLAMFEHIQKQQKPIALSRSNSSVSRTSSSRVSSGSMARTSIDFDSERVRSQRNSAVMAYYDEGFKEKMEGVEGGWRSD